MNLGAHLHYRASFELRGRQGANPQWADIVRDIRQWLLQRTPTDKGLLGSWFFQHGDWKPPSTPRTSIRVESAVGEGTETSPSCWAVRYEHPCNEVTSRQWRTEVGITRSSETGFRIVLTTIHWLGPTYIGDEPRPPVPTSPTIVRSLLGLRGWEAFAGTEILSSQPKEVIVGTGDEFFDRLRDPGRACPVVYVSREGGSGDFKFDPEHLARVLAGMASVYASSSTELDEELTVFLEKDFRCANGMVRIYQPRVRFDVPSDFKRHRFFARGYIIDQGARHTEDLIVRGIACRGWTVDEHGVASIDDVVGRAREFRLQQLKSEADSAAKQQELIDLFSAENKRLEEAKAQQAEIIRNLQGENQRLESDLQDRDDTVGRLEYDRGQFQTRCEAAESQARGIADAIRNLERLPESIAEVVSLIEKIHGARIAFTDRAKKSAETADFNDINEAWRCLWAVATLLHDLHFPESGAVGNLEKDFLATSGFELSLREKGSTQANKKLTALRKDSWKGQEIDITPYVKAEKRGTFFRVYYWPDQSRKLIVVGSCGNHLDTSGTRRRK
jgi:archaellum component FlaC